MELQEPVLLKRIDRYVDVTSIEEYEAMGGFDSFKKAVSMDKEDIIEEIVKANLRGRGGAAYPAGRKWKHLYEMENSTKYIVCNADEGEPGTFKDKVLLEKDPFSIIEGMIIAGYLFGAKRGYIYIRGEYIYIQKIFNEALKNAEEAGYLGKNIKGIENFDYKIYVISGSGAYVCGENSALLNSIEGKIGRPRVKPPHLAEVGLYSKPTLVNNVETFACVPIILNIGGERFLELGTEQGGGTKLISISGHVKNRGVYEVPLGTSLKEILFSEKYAGGSFTDAKLKFCHFGGQAGPIGFIEDLDIDYSYEDFEKNNLSIGTGAIVVMDENVCIVSYLKKVLEFFVHESCGKCTPCRLGTTRILELLQDFDNRTAKSGDIERLEEITKKVSSLSACGLGQAVDVPVLSGLKHGRQDFENCIIKERPRY